MRSKKVHRGRNDNNNSNNNNNSPLAGLVGEFNSGLATAARRTLSFSQLYVNLEAGREDIRGGDSAKWKKTMEEKL